MKSETYPVSEDSVLLAKALEGSYGGAFLEIGTGSGATLKELAPGFELAVGTDIVRPASADALPNGSLILADAASCFRDSSFDLVAFNPPYLPSEGVADAAVDGGEGGVEVPLRFLREAFRVVKREGRVVFLLSDEDDLGRVEAEAKERGFEVTRVAEARMFYETLAVYEARRGQAR